MHRSRPRFTIRTLMIAVAVVGALLAPADGWRGVTIALVIAIPFVTHFAATRLAFRRKRRAVAFSFWLLVTLINVAYAGIFIYPDHYVVVLLGLGWFFIIVPMLISFGIAWSVLATHQSAVPRRPTPLVWLSVVTLTVLPILAPLTLWPLHAAFWSAQPKLEQLADHFASGRPVSLPRWAGVFRLVGSRVDPVSGNVGLILDPWPSGPTGLVRLYPSAPPNHAGPIRGSSLNVDLGGGWWYREEY
jgi:hypothetical protein